MARELTTTDALVLRTVDYGDNHVIVTLLTRDAGRLGAIARSAKRSRKRFGGALLPFRVIRANLAFRRGRDLAELSEASVERDFPGLEGSYDKITVASYATELMRLHLRDGDDAQSSYDLLSELYDRVASSDDSASVLRIVLHHFELGLLRVAGAAPTLYACNRCGIDWTAMDKFRLGRDGHGLVCSDCVRSGERWGIVTSDVLQTLHYIEQPQGSAPVAVADDAVASQIRRILDASLELIIDSELRSRPMLDTVLTA